MTAEEVLDYMHSMDLAVTLVGENLLVTPPGQMTTEIRAILQANKQALVALLRQRDTEQTITPKTAISAAQAIQMACERLLTDEEKRSANKAFQSLRDQYGHALVKAGWDRKAVFDGLDPTKCKKAGDVPGIIGLLMAGGRLVKIHPDRLDLEFPNGMPFSKIRGGCLMGGKVLDDYLRTGK